MPSSKRGVTERLGQSLSGGRPQEQTDTGAVRQSRREFLGLLSVGALTRVAGVADPPAAAEPRGGPTLTTDHEVRIDGRVERIDIAIPAAQYRREAAAGRSYADAFATARDQPYLGPVTAALVGRTADRAGAIRAAQSLVARIPYATDLDSTGAVEFVRYPAETILDRVGDCEDKAILLAGLLARPPLDCRTGLLVIRDHCATLVARADLPRALVAADPLSVTVGDTEYVYVEAVKPKQPGRAASDYGTRPRVAAYDGRWRVLDAGVLLEWGRETVEQRGVGFLGDIVN